MNYIISDLLNNQISLETIIDTAVCITKPTAAWLQYIYLFVPLSAKKEIQGAFHYAKLTGQRPMGIPKENGMTFSDPTRPTRGNATYHFLFLL